MLQDLLSRVIALPQAPTWVWYLVGGQFLISGAALIWVHRRKLAAATTTGNAENRLATALLLAALTFCSVVLAAFVVGTYEGSTAFAADKLGWLDWRKPIPWATLDAAGFGFGLLWIRAVVLVRSPLRPRRVVYLCAGFSALLQMIQGGQNHKWQAGMFLAFIAVIGGLVLHTLVDQLRASSHDDAAWHRNPPFGLRWITYFPGTLCAWLAWINYPPVDGTKPTVANAVTHLTHVREIKAETKQSGQVRADRSGRPGQVLPGPADRVNGHTPGQVLLPTLSATPDRTPGQNPVLRGQVPPGQGGQAVTGQADRSAGQVQPGQADRRPARTGGQNLSAPPGQTLPGQGGPNPVRPAIPPRAETAGQVPGQQEQGGQKSDEEIADSLYDEYCVSMNLDGKPLSRYRVETVGRCRQRQANRVLSALADRWTEQVAAVEGGQADRARTGQADRPSGQAESGQADRTPGQVSVQADTDGVA